MPPLILPPITATRERAHFNLYYLCSSQDHESPHCCQMERSDGHVRVFVDAIIEHMPKLQRCTFDIFMENHDAVKECMEVLLGWSVGLVRGYTALRGFARLRVFTTRFQCITGPEH